MSDHATRRIRKGITALRRASSAGMPDNSAYDYTLMLEPETRRRYLEWRRRNKR